MVSTIALPDWLESFYQDWAPAIRILLTIVAALIVRAILQFAIRRTVRGVSKSVRKIEDNGDSSPLAQARLLQRTRTIGNTMGSRQRNFGKSNSFCTS